jgi:hypothetical protein
LVAVTETLCRAAIHTLKMKGVAIHFESQIAMLKACDVDVGDISHSQLVKGNNYIST